ncbi:amidohydrolase family protein [Pseudothermotoga sp. U03pept]|uniref:amidohydrolase family protein n=1 Tax=Pseudothermotoga sp. U03pept TaxID=3447012 RepID=UPI003F1067B9
MRLIDSHVHFPVGLVAESEDDPWLKKEKERWLQAWNFPKPVPIDDFDELSMLWYKEAEDQNIDKIVFVTAKGNENMLKLVLSHPDRFIGYAHHDPSAKDAAQELEDCIKKGLKGYKILGPKVSIPLNDRSLYPVWEVANAYEIPVLIHFGIMGAAGGIAHHVNINPLIIHDVAKQFKKIKFIIPHFGCGYLFETLNLSWACPNVYVDTSGSNQWMRWMPYEVNLQTLFRKYRETIGAERIIFGTDSSWFPRGFCKPYLDEQLRSMVYVGYSEDEIDRVLYKNIAVLLGLVG